MDPKHTYRLPTEAEWEYATRAHTKTAYSFGNDPATLSQYSWYYDNSAQKTHNVAGKKPNPAGLYDMEGNVGQWCQDWYDKYPADSVDPTGPSEGSNRVVRGGGWDYGSNFLRSAQRGYFSPDGLGRSVGFRLVRTSK